MNHRDGIRSLPLAVLYDLQNRGRQGAVSLFFKGVPRGPCGPLKCRSGLQVGRTPGSAADALVGPTAVRKDARGATRGSRADGGVRPTSRSGAVFQGRWPGDMASEGRRKTPEEYLREAEAEETARRRGYLKIFLGYASGVGKSLRMLNEARRRSQRGQHVVVGALQPRVAPELSALLQKLEVVPEKRIGEGSAIDVEEIIRRHPGVCFVDGLAYDNPAGARHPYRWQDVRELTDAGIKVITSVNIQYIAELAAEVEAITGKHVTQTVPLSFVETADEIEIVDAPAEIALERSEDEQHGGRAAAERLSVLRELALVLAAEVVDRQLGTYLSEHHIPEQFGAQERILVCLTPRSNAREMIETGRAIAERFHGELIAAYVSQPEMSPQDQAALDEKLALAREAGARVEILEGDDPVQAILEFARSQGITQLFIGHSRRGGIWPRLRGNPVERLIRESQGIDVRVFPQ